MTKQNTITITAVALGLALSHSAAFSKKLDQKEIKQNFTEVMILDKGVKRTLYIEKEEGKTESSKKKIGTYSAKMQASKNGVIVTFKNPSKTDISKFESTYGLKLKEKLLTCYHVFENISGSSDIQVIDSIIRNEKNVKTVKPNWRKKNQPR